ncbi:MAG: putative capsid protein [Cressdnaviricota sp.]|nr:MAG: putative capsid protein [Cressdnaviricota sp.]
MQDFIVGSAANYFGVDPKFAKYSVNYIQKMMNNRKRARYVAIGKNGAVAPFGNAGFDDPQYVSQVRHNYTKYGKKEKKNLRNLYRKVMNDYNISQTRFQSVISGGFAKGVGPIPLRVYTSVNADGNRFFPIYAFRLSVNNGIQDRFVSGAYVGKQNNPLIMYQLYRTYNTTTALTEYQWLPCGDTTSDLARVVRNNMDYNVAPLAPEPYQQGANWAKYVPVKGHQEIEASVQRYQHNWSDIRLGFYAGSLQETKFKVEIAKFKNGWGPASESIHDNGVGLVKFVDDASVLSNEEKAAKTVAYDTAVWNKYIHPNYPAETFQQNYGYKPWTTLKAEEFTMPPSTASEAVQVKNLKKIFWRNDAWYNCANPVNTINIQDKNVNASLQEDGTTQFIPGYYSTDGVNTTEYINVRGVFPAPQDQVWCIVSATDFNLDMVSSRAQYAVPITGALPSYPTFDIFIRNRYTTPSDSGTFRPKYLAPPAALLAADPVTVSVPPLLDRINEESIVPDSVLIE